MKITLVYAPVSSYVPHEWPDSFNSMGIHEECIYFQHGLCMISAVLKRDGHQVELIDTRECKDGYDVERQIIRQNSDLYGVYMSSVDFPHAKWVGDILKRLGKRSIVGGPHPSINPDDVLQRTQFDQVFVGEAEKTLPEVVDKLDKFPRLVLGEHPDLDELPYEDRDLFNRVKMFATKHPFYPTPFINVICGRGCMYNCSFCQPAERKIFGRFRLRSLSHFMGEIYALLRFKPRIFQIDDDTFTQDPDYCLRFAEAYKDIRVPLIIQGRADNICNRPDVIKRLREVGLEWILIGFESGSQRILNLLRKGTTVEQNYEAAKICHDLGINIWANYMLGLPTETKEEAKVTIDMVAKIEPKHASPAFYTPTPGSDLYDYCAENGLLINPYLSRTPRLSGSKKSPRVEPKIKGVDYEYLMSIIKW